MSIPQTLTEEQKALLPKYAEKGIADGLSCAPVDEAAAEEYSRKLMKWLDRPYAGTLIMDSPLSSCYAAHRVVSMECATESGVVNLEAAKHQAYIDMQERKKVQFVWPYLDGQWFSYYDAWVSFYRDVVGVSFDNIPLWVITEQVQFGGVYPLNCNVIISRRPVELHVNSENVLHCDNGPAVRYADGLSVYALNGVVVPQWLACEPSGNIDVKEFSKISNAEVRREFVRKVGIERICMESGSTCLDKSGDYELLLVDLGGASGECAYLKMLNPSIGVWHLEGVPNSCRTVKDALIWRNQCEAVPETLT